MWTFAPAWLPEAVATVESPTLAAGSLAAVGLLGVTDWILGDDDPPETPEDTTGGGSGMFEEPETAGDGGVVEGDDEFAFDDAGGDEFDEFDVDGMEEGEGGGGAQVQELEGRVEELEDEISSISSTVSTVRTENEQISESVDDIEENVRKLLDIYKMVTKGVNPFVDDDAGGGVPGGQESSLGLFDQEDEEEPDDAPENLDTDVTDADAEEFFDDDFEEDEEFDDADSEPAEEAEPTPDEAAETAPVEEEAPDPEQTDDEGGAKSFDELRQEYEEGADWSEGESAAEDDASDSGVEDEQAGDLEEDGEMAERASQAADEVDDERVDGLFGDEGRAGESAGARQPAPQPAARTQARAPPRGGAQGSVAGDAPGEKPYLRRLPSGYVSDLLVMEWIEFLVTESSPAGAHRAVTYYENVGWIGHRAADQLRAFVDGHPEASVDDAAEDEGSLTMDHHTTSLRYVARITGDVQENVLAAWEEGDNRWLHR